MDIFLRPPLDRDIIHGWAFGCSVTVVMYVSSLSTCGNTVITSFCHLLVTLGIWTKPLVPVQDDGELIGRLMSMTGSQLYFKLFVVGLWDDITIIKLLFPLFPLVPPCWGSIPNKFSMWVHILQTHWNLIGLALPSLAICYIFVLHPDPHRHIASHHTPRAALSLICHSLMSLLLTFFPHFTLSGFLSVSMEVLSCKTAKVHHEARVARHERVVEDKPGTCFLLTVSIQNWWGRTQGYYPNKCINRWIVFGWQCELFTLSRENCPTVGAVFQI